MATKTPNYTEEMVAKMHDMYAELGNDGIEAIAEAVGKPVRSVRAKLVRDGIYVAPEKGAKATAKKDGPSKKELLNVLDSRGFDSKGFEGATKEALARLISMVPGKVAN